MSKKLKNLKKLRFPIYYKYLRINTKKPLSIFLACLTPFLQAMMGSVLQIYVIEKHPEATATSALIYWTMFALNGKRVALGNWSAITIFIIFAALGTTVGIYVSDLL